MNGRLNYSREWYGRDWYATPRVVSANHLYSVSTCTTSCSRRRKVRKVEKMLFFRVSNKLKETRRKKFLIIIGALLIPWSRQGLLSSARRSPKFWKRVGRSWDAGTGRLVRTFRSYPKHVHRIIPDIHTELRYHRRVQRSRIPQGWSRLHFYHERPRVDRWVLFNKIGIQKKSFCITLGPRKLLNSGSSGTSLQTHASRHWYKQQERPHRMGPP